MEPSRLASAESARGAQVAASESRLRSLPSRERPVLIALTIALWASLCLVALSTQGTFDTYRDAWFAAEIAGGRSFPMVGPGINQTAHLGPLWFYLLALPAMLFDPIHAVAIACALLVALKLPLGWVLGKRLFGTAAAFALCCLLFAPGWWPAELGVLTHTSGVAASLLYLALSSESLYRRTTIASALQLGVAMLLAISAHPTNLYFCVVAGLAATLIAWHRRSWLIPIWVLLPLLVGFLPYLLSATFVSDLTQLGHYGAGLGQTTITSLPTRAAEIAVAGAIGGARFAYIVWGGVPPELAWLAAPLPFFAVATAGWPSWRPPLGRRSLHLALGSLLLLVGFLFFLAMVRPVTPPWMAFGIWPVLAFALAGIFASAVESRRSDSVLPNLAATILAAVCLLPGAWLVSRIGVHGDSAVWARYPANSAGAMSITTPVLGRQESTVLPFTLSDIPELLPDDCSIESLHGPLARIADRTFGVGFRMRCSGVDQVRLGRSKTSAPGAARFGVPVAKQRAFCQQSSVHSLGDIPNHLFSVYGNRAGLGFSDPRAFPPRKISPTPGVHTLRIAAEGRSNLALTNLIPDYSVWNVIEVRRNGIAIQPAFSQRESRIYTCPECVSDSSYWEVKLQADPEFIDVVTFDCPSSQS